MAMARSCAGPASSTICCAAGRTPRRGEGVQRSRKLRLRALWFQVHKWIGLLLAVLIVPISLTGSALVWHDWLETLNPARAVSGEPVLPHSADRKSTRLNSSH